MVELVAEPYDRHVVKTHTQSFVRHTVRVDEKNRSLLNAEAARANCSPDLLLTRLVNRHLSNFVRESRIEEAEQRRASRRDYQWQDQTLTASEYEVLRALVRLRVARKMDGRNLFCATSSRVAREAGIENARTVGLLLKSLVAKGLIARMKISHVYERETGNTVRTYAFVIYADIRDVEKL